MKAEALVDTVANRLVVVEVKTHCDTLAKVDAKVLVDTVADRSSDVDTQRLTSRDGCRRAARHTA